MTGKQIDEKKRFELKNIGNLVLEVKNLSRKNNFKDINLKIHAGEILGITGLMGSGKTELAHCLFGLNKQDCGEIYIDGKKVIINSPEAAKKLGIGYIPENKKESLIMDQKVEYNIILTILEKILNKFKIISQKIIKDISNEWIEKLMIKVPKKEIDTLFFSGGNQQKVVLAKWLAANPKLLSLDNPTSGIDVKAKEGIFKILHDLANHGTSIILITPEVLEVLFNANRIIVMRKGKFVSSLKQ